MKLHTVVEKHCHRGWAVDSHPSVDPSTRQVRWGLNKYFDIILALSFESTVFSSVSREKVLFSLMFISMTTPDHISHCVCACSFQAKSQVRSKQPNCAACVKWCLLTVTCKGPWTPHVCDCSVQGCNRRDNNGVTKKTLRLSSKLRWSQFDLRQKTEWFIFIFFCSRARCDYYCTRPRPNMLPELHSIIKLWIFNPWFIIKKMNIALS